MRRLAAAFFFILLILPIAATAGRAAEATFPPLSGRVVDQAGVLSAAAEKTLLRNLEAHERATGTQVVVATLASLDGADIADYGVALGRAWGIGQKDKNTGAILLVAPNERAVRIEVGYGLEGQLTDALSRLIIEREILPRFRAGDLEAGIVAGAAAMLSVLRGEAPAPPIADSAPAHARDPGEIPLILILIVFILLVRFGRGRRRRGLWPLVLGGVWHGGSRRGGGFGGFRGGGGSFGGGGASGRW